jgi:hypothetical protein
MNKELKMTVDAKLEAIKQLLVKFNSGELSSYDFACAVEKVAKS